MILLDTNVISALIMPTPEPSVLAWLERQDLAALATTSISVAEIRYGLELLPTGKRRTDLIDRFESFIDRGFRQAIWAFDADAAYEYGVLAAQLKSRGFHPGYDTLIAAIAKARSATIATRNERDFEQCGVPLINPFVST
jgi:predicted nucleic acid-binding protein